jgi:hypothetical protein
LLPFIEDSIFHGLASACSQKPISPAVVDRVDGQGLDKEPQGLTISNRAVT